jgi:ABC-type branched-subunit amino acid transport system substrate-binding protein
VSRDPVSHRHPELHAAGVPRRCRGAAEAELAQELGLRRVFLLSDGSVCGRELSRGFRGAAGHIGVTASTPEIWNSKRRYEQLLEQVDASNAQGVLLAGYGYGGGGLIRALRSRFWLRSDADCGGWLPHDPKTLEAAGPAARGMCVNTSAVLDQSLTPSGLRLVAAFERTRHGDTTVPSGTYLPEILEAAELVVDAIARSDGTRASVLHELSASRVSGGLFGGFRFDRDGDMTPAPFAIVRITGGRGDPSGAPELRGSVFDRTVRVPLSLLNGRRTVGHG